jgi:putative ABC transport system permease protein
MLRATLKSLLARKLRLILSGLAVVLGVMFVSGAFVLTDTLSRSFDNLFRGIYAATDVQVTAVPKIAGEGPGGDSQTPTNLLAGLVQQVQAVPGVAKATGVAISDGARLIGANGKVVASFGPPRLGADWPSQSDQVELRQGRGPTSDDEIAINAALAAAAGVHVGDRVGVLTLAPRRDFTVVGLFGYSGNRDSLGGSQEITFTLPVAQRLMLGESAVFSQIDVTAAGGVSPDQLKQRVAAALGPGYQIKTGKQLGDEAATAFQQALSFFNKILLGFAGVALFVGVFLILNTFSIIVAQRSREVALMRALGAGRRQVIGSVLLEAVLIGAVASVLGLLAGVGIGALLAYVFGHTGGADLELAGIGVPASAIIGAFAVGILVTVVAALLPAIRASRVAPVAALRDAAVTDRPLTKLTVSGAVVGVLGAGLLGIGLAGKAGSGTLWSILGGVLLAFIGTALLTPLVARPVAGVIGRLFAWSVPGKLGRLNAGRNPRRTAITAAALMVGIALITGIYTVFASAKTSVTHLVDTQFKAELIISGENGNREGIPATFDPAVLTKAAQLAQIDSAAGVALDQAMVDGEHTFVGVGTDDPTLVKIFGLTPVAGTLDQVGDGQIVVDEKTAAGRHVGDRVTVQLSRGEPSGYTISGIYAKSDLVSGWILPASAIHNFRTDQLVQGYLTVKPGADLAAAKQGVAALLADSPEVNVADRHEYIEQQSASVNGVLSMVQILLALAILIAVLGIVNTLALSVLERTRELGLLRAVGLRRAQTMRMVTVEAVVVSVFGAVLGLVVGAGLGVASVRALHDQGITQLTLPWTQMVTYLVLAAVVGVAAAVLPAIRAARVNVLDAIAYE